VMRRCSVRSLVPRSRATAAMSGRPLAKPRFSTAITCSEKELRGWRRPKLSSSAGVMISINTDAHAIEGFTEMIYGINVARRAWLTPKQINPIGQ